MTAHPQPQAIALALPRHQRVDARGRLAVKRRSGRSRVDRLFQEGAAKIRMPVPDGDALEAVLINTAGGLTGGDKLSWDIDIAAGASAVVTTQACEKLYRAGGGKARVAVDLGVAAGGRLCWLPQETILFDGSALSRRIACGLAADAELLLCEATIVGRSAHGEIVTRAHFRDDWRVRIDGRLVHAEAMLLGGRVDAVLGLPAVAGGAKAFASVLMIGPRAEAMLKPARAILDGAGGASFWEIAGTGKLLARLVAGDGFALRQRLVPLLGLLNGQAGLPRVWAL